MKLRAIHWKAIVIAGVMAVAVTLFKFSPYRETNSECGYCGRHREEKWRLGVKVHDTITETEASRWADPSGSPNHAHTWIPFGHHVRNRFFGHSMIGCGGMAGVSAIHRARIEAGEPQTREWLQGFRARIGGDSRTLHDYYMEIELWKNPHQLENFHDARRREQ